MTKYQYNIPLPMTVDNYQVAQLYTVAEVSKEETGGANGIKVLINEPFDENTHKPDTPLLGGKFTTGQYTLKEYYLQKKIPSYIRMLVKESYLTVVEEAWNAYPYCRTVIRNNGIDKSRFQIIIESYHKPGMGEENPHDIPDFKSVNVVNLDIGDDQLAAKYRCNNPATDPRQFKSASGVGPLKTGWMNNYSGDLMCAYKLVTITANITMIGSTIQSYIASAEGKLFFDFHRKVFCLMDKWNGMTMEDIREHERKTKEDLEKQFSDKEIRGHLES